MKTKHLISLLLIVLTIGLYSQSNTDFIIISNVGDSHTSLEPTVISSDTVKKIDYSKEDSELHRKFYMHRDFIVSTENYHKLFSYLNLWNTPRVRKEGFVRDANALMIIDYRQNGIDYELLTLKDIQSTLTTLNSLYCYFTCNGFGKPLIDQIEVVYKFYINFYDPKHELFRTELLCK
jgi:hypothetical protein